MVRSAAGRESVRAVWANEIGGLTFQLGSGTERRFAKWSPPAGPDLAVEVARLRWAGTWVAVPRVLDHGRDSDGSWMITAGLVGDSAVAPRWLAAPATAVRAIGEGLRALHDALPVGGCPFTWSLADRLAYVRSCANRDLIDPSGRHGGQPSRTAFYRLLWDLAA